MLANEIAAVILAAGASSRFARPKQLVQFRGKSLVRRIVDAAAGAEWCPVAVVIGSQDANTRAELAGTSAIAGQNKDWQRGIGASIRAGVQGAIENPTKVSKPPLLEAIVLLTCDQPFVEGQTIREIIAL